MQASEFALVAKPSTSGKTEQRFKRLNRAVPLTEALGKALDPAMKRRGFATRDIIEHWRAIAPPPYDAMARPDKLSWPRGERGAEGAVLHVSCHAGHKLALSHEGDKVASAINRYFGYVLVSQVRISATPFVEDAPLAEPSAPALDPERRAAIDASVEQVEQPELRAALQMLGEAIAARSQRR